MDVRRLRRAAEHRLLEERVQAGGRVAADRVDRRRQAGARDLAPVGVDAEEDVLQPAPIEMLLSELAGLTAMQRPSRNSLTYVVPASLGSGGRVLIANWLRAGLDVLDAGVAAVGHVLEVDVVVERCSPNSSSMYGCAALEPEPISVTAPAAGASARAGTATSAPTRVLLLIDLNGVPFGFERQRSASLNAP